MNETVFSNTRLLVQPEFKIAESLMLDRPQQMDGIELLEKIHDVSIPLVFFDPQYRTILNKLKYGNEGERQKQRALLPQMSEEIIIKFIQEIDRILIPSGHLMMWVDKYILANGCKLSNLQIVDFITWNKQKIGMGYRSRRCSEFLIIYQKPPVRAKGIWQIHDIPDVWSEKMDKTHAHAKPIKLMERLICAVTNEGDIIVDPAAGGYNTLRAAQNTNRHFLGCDIHSKN